MELGKVNGVNGVNEVDDSYDETYDETYDDSYDETYEEAYEESQDFEPNAAKWYFLNRFKQKQGPFTQEEMIEKYQNGYVISSNYVIQEGMTQWCKFSESPLASICNDGLPDIPLDCAKNTWAWCIALVPVIGIVLLFNGIDIPIWGYWIVNSILILLDLYEIHKVRKGFEIWDILGFVIIPVYLFVRASKVDKKYGYAILDLTAIILTVLIGSSAFTLPIHQNTNKDTGVQNRGAISRQVETTSADTQEYELDKEIEDRLSEVQGDLGLEITPSSGISSFENPDVPNGTSYVLEQGNYIGGEDIPVGRYRVEFNDGNEFGVTVTIEDTLYQDITNITDIPYCILVAKGSKINISLGSLKFTKITTDKNSMFLQDDDTYILGSGLYFAGIDIPFGKYDIEAIDGNDFGLTVQTEEDYYIPIDIGETYHNLTISDDNRVIYVSLGSIKLIPKD